MRAVLQRVTSASVDVEGRTVGAIGTGLLVLLGIAKGDTAEDAGYLATKITRLRIFTDDRGKMNSSVTDSNGALLVVSQFTLLADTGKGNRPSFDEAADAAVARGIYDAFLSHCRALGVSTQSGVFQAHMVVRLVNDGPVTIICESRKKITT